MERTVDLAAVGRVAKKVELKAVRLAEISAKCMPDILGSLLPDVDLDCHVGRHDATSVEVVCNYKFTARSGDQQAVDSAIRYLLQYEISGGESPSDSDLAEFARANGALNSWPFVREVLYGLTSRMGYPPVHFASYALQCKNSASQARRADYRRYAHQDRSTNALTKAVNKQQPGHGLDQPYRTVELDHENPDQTASTLNPELQQEVGKPVVRNRATLRLLQLLPHSPDATSYPRDGVGGNGSCLDSFGLAGLTRSTCGAGSFFSPEIIRLRASSETRLLRSLTALDSRIVVRS